MSAANNKQIALDFLQALAEGRLHDARDMVAEDATWQSPPSLAGGPYKGRDEIFGTYIAIDDELFETGTRSYDFEILNAIADEGSAAIEIRHFDKTADGEPYQSEYHMLYRIRDGKIWQVKEYFDSLFMKQAFDQQGIEFPKAKP